MERISEEDLERYQALANSVNPRTNIVAFATFYAEHVPILMAALRQAYAHIDELEVGRFNADDLRLRLLAVAPELIEVAELFLSELALCSAMTGPLAEKVMDLEAKIRIVIAKAKGQVDPASEPST